MFWCNNQSTEKVNNRCNNKYVFITGTRECKELDINVKCDHRANVRQTRQVNSQPTIKSEDTYVLDAIIPVDE